MLTRICRLLQTRVLQGNIQIAAFCSAPDSTLVEKSEVEPKITDFSEFSNISVKTAKDSDVAFQYKQRYQETRQAWIENLNKIDEEKLGIMELHPAIYGAPPRIDLIHRNIVWQTRYRHISFEHAPSRAELRGGGRKPWPQKGLGRARHGSIRSPLFKGGGSAHGPRSPTSHFYMLTFFERVQGLVSTLSVKLAQDDLHIVDSLDIPTDEPEYLEKLVEERKWGLSVLFVDDTDYMPRNITAATEKIKHMNLMPVYGLNVYSMLKHETLVLTTAAAKEIEEKILFHLHRSDYAKINKPFKIQHV